MTNITVDEITQLVLKELERAQKKFSSFNNPHEGYAVIKEELDELWDDVKQNNTGHACKEAIQVAAMAMRFIFDLSDNYVLRTTTKIY